MIKTCLRHTFLILSELRLELPRFEQPAAFRNRSTLCGGFDGILHQFCKSPSRRCLNDPHPPLSSQDLHLKLKWNLLVVQESSLVSNLLGFREREMVPCLRRHRMRARASCTPPHAALHAMDPIVVTFLRLERP